MTIPTEMQVATQWGSHLPALLACIAVTEGPVLELGVGHFSTPQLHALCGAMGRNLYSIESDAEWRKEFRAKYEGRPNFGEHIFSESLPPEFVFDFAVAFIDHSPGGANRAAAFKALIHVSDYVVMHDAQKDAENFQAVEPMLAGLNWHLCTGYFPHTLIASKTRQIPEVLLSM